MTFESYLAYGSWSSMRRRCYDSKRDNYKYYGGRGIKVCERWSNSFLAFLEDMGERPSPKHELDRINVNGNYEPSNCRWITHREQCLNRRPYSNSGFKGVYFRNGKYDAGVRRFGKYVGLGRFQNIKDAIKAVESHK